MRTLLSGIDPQSRHVLEVFRRKVVFFLMIAAIVGMTDLKRLGLACVLLQAQCLISGWMSIAAAFFFRQRINAASLTYWDEAIAFASLAVLGHIGSRLLVA